MAKKKISIDLEELLCLAENANQDNAGEYVWNKYKEQSSNKTMQ